jgi:hypothetical protein
LDQALAPAEQAQRQQIRVSELLGERERLIETGTGTLDVSLTHRQQAGHDEPVSVLDACLLAVLEQPLRTGEPAGAARYLPSKAIGSD